MTFSKKFLTLALATATTSVFANNTTVEEIEVPVVKCSQPVISISIAEIECKAANCQNPQTGSAGIAALAALASGQGNLSGIGEGVKSMFSNAIKETNCFKIVDLEKFEKMKKMLEASGQKVTPPQIDIYIMGDVTSINVSKEGGALGGGFIPLIGAITKNTQTADMTFDMSTMNPTTLELDNSKTFKANSNESSWGLFGLAGPVGGGWSVTKNIALDTVIRDVVFSATNYLAESYAKDYIISRPDPKVLEEKVKKQMSLPDNDPAKAIIGG